MRMQQRCWSIFAAKASFPLIPWKYSGVEYFQYSHVNAGILISPSCESVTEKYLFPSPVTEKLWGPESHRIPRFLRIRAFLLNTELTDAIIASLVHFYDMKLESFHFLLI
jgi:hypothetical protein